MNISEILIHIIASLIATSSFGILLNINPKNILPAGIGGSFIWMFYLFLFHFTQSIPISAFIASVLAGFYSEIAARIYKKPALTFLICAIICLVPGADMYRTMLYSIQHSHDKTIVQGFQTLYTAGAIATGIAFSTSILMMIRKARKLTFK